VANFISDLGFEPIVLSDKPDRGLTIVEKFQQNSDVRFAVILLTPDDEGREKATKRRGKATKGTPSRADPEYHYRARQNVIFEAGYFMGRIDRSNMAILLGGDVELPSDLGSMLHIQMNNEKWKEDLGKEIRDAFKQS
jgi:predicted nucleotide-binding protein